MKGIITTLIPIEQDEHGKLKGGFGFIRDEEGRDRFFHARDLRDFSFYDLRLQMHAEFDRQDGGGRGNGLRAENVRVVL